MIAIWITSIVRKECFASKNVSLVELGPGKGTLLCDILNTWKCSFSRTFEMLKSVHLVEQSEIMRKSQSEHIKQLFPSLSVYWHDHFSSIPKSGKFIEIPMRDYM